MGNCRNKIILTTTGMDVNVFDIYNFEEAVDLVPTTYDRSQSTDAVVVSPQSTRRMENEGIMRFVCFVVEWIYVANKKPAQ